MRRVWLEISARRLLWGRISLPKIGTVAVDSNKLEHGGGMMHADVPSFRGLGLRVAVFQCRSPESWQERR